MYFNKLRSIALFLLCLSLPVAAADVPLGDTLKQRLEGIFGAAPDRVAEAPVKGMLEVTYGADIFYVTADGHYLLHGQMFDMANKMNLTEKRQATDRKKIIDAVDESSMIVYKAKGKEKHVITVFTDIDCPYCRKLHEGMDQMNELGITVRYMAYPRAGLNSPSYYKAESVWCAKDRQKAMDDAKLHGKVAQRRCADSPVKEQLDIGQKIGVTGTPAIVFSNGHLMPGYAPPRKLAAILDKAGT